MCGCRYHSNDTPHTDKRGVPSLCTCGIGVATPIPQRAWYTFCPGFPHPENMEYFFTISSFCGITQTTKVPPSTAGDPVPEGLTLYKLWLRFHISKIGAPLPPPLSQLYVWCSADTWHNHICQMPNHHWTESHNRFSVEEDQGHHYTQSRVFQSKYCERTEN